MTLARLELLSGRRLRSSSSADDIIALAKAEGITLEDTELVSIALTLAGNDPADELGILAFG